MMYHALRGLGDCSFDDPSGCTVDGSGGDVTTTYTPPIVTNLPSAEPTPGNVYNIYGSPTGSNAPSGNASSGFNWGIFAPLINAAGAIGSGYAASQLKPGQSMQTAGTTIVGAGQSLPGSTVSGGLNLSGLTTPLLIGGGLLVLVMMMKGRGK